MLPSSTWRVTLLLAFLQSAESDLAAGWGRSCLITGSPELSPHYEIRSLYPSRATKVPASPD